MRIVLILICAVMLGACKVKPPEGMVSGGEKDSLLLQVEKRLADKRRYDNLRHELYSSNLGRSIKKYKPIIKKYAKRYGFDWRLIAAQIVQESGFREKARSHAGARGLMQLMPYTAREISRELDIQYIMKNPRENITAGIYHLNKQMRYFPDATWSERTRLALASYNAGVGRVLDAQAIADYNRQPLNRWGTVKPYLSMLKRSDWQLHLQVWPEGKPRYGYFYGYNETINYVDNIWKMYTIYRNIL